MSDEGNRGNSAAVRIPASVMQAMHLDLDQVVGVREEAARIVIEPVRQKTYDSAELLRSITPTNRHDAMDFGLWLAKRSCAAEALCLPDAGDGVWLDLTPQAGREQAGIVLQPAKKIGLGCAPDSCIPATLRPSKSLEARKGQGNS